MSEVRAHKIETESDRADALRVIDQVYLQEKKWIHGLENQVTPPAGERDKISWFICRVNGVPAGVLRLLYDPPLEIPAEFGVTLNPGIDLVRMASEYRFAEIGRFAVLPEHRRNMFVSLRLMRAAIGEVVERNYTHFITDVFEGEASSPFNFHTRVLGFEVIGRHLRGDLDCSCTRIILTLDILKAYRCLKGKRSRVLSSLTEGLEDALDKKIGLAG